MQTKDDALIDEPFPPPQAPQKGEHLETGRKGEALARKFLWKKGLRLLGHNVQTYAGEIDIIAEHRGRVHFVEVKTSKSDSIGAPEERVNAEKQRRLRGAARAWLSEYRDPPLNGVAFDVMSVVLAADKKSAEKIEWIEEAF